MKNQPETVDATFYAVVLPSWSRSHRDPAGRPILEGAKVDRVTQTRPDVVRGGGIVTRLTLRVDAAALLPLQPEAIIAVHPGQVDVIQAAATNPDDAEAGESS